MSTISERMIFDLVGSLYDQARESSRDGWESVFLKIADIFTSGAGGLLLRNEEYNRYNFAAGTTSPEFLREYVDHYQFVNPFRGSLNRLKLGEVFLRSSAMPDDEYIRTEYYQDYLRRIDAFNFAFYNLVESGGTTSSLVITRPKSRPDFTASENRAMAILVPHLTRAMKVYLSFADIQNENQTILAALSAMPHGVIVIDKNRTIKFANEKAESLILQNDGLVVDRAGSLQANSNGDDRRLSELLNGIFDPAIDNLAYHGGALRILRSDGSRTLHLLVTPFSAHVFLGVGSEVMAMIFVHDGDEHNQTQETVLVQLYGLTAAEAHLAAMLADGKSMDEASEILNIAASTGRTHLRHIFSKTDTNRQSELVKLIINGVASLSIGE